MPLLDLNCYSGSISPLGQVGVRNPSIHHSDSDRCADSNGQVLFYMVMVSDST
ncbi:hypothetical protein PROFUN_12889 [Planoprotostelium fungivorum]|uniref:Uncharacterized protein n=1 Tax=Planoprotostelium fungivorum TaxID=1890364 RepID=A0A2P6MWJ4_9EUKA|nr:hypothetical protein PROFUN_12889 [Planoprotostelium fungivorum]